MNTPSPACTVRIAAAQYDVAPLADWVAYERRITAWVDEAALAGARLLLFPEYFAMELASLFGPEVSLSLPRQLNAMQELLADFLALFARLARTHGACIVAGSYPVRLADGSYRNRCHLFHPDGRRMFQDKLQMTRFETEEWHIGAGDTLKVFDTAFVVTHRDRRQQTGQGQIATALRLLANQMPDASGQHREQQQEHRQQCDGDGFFHGDCLCRGIVPQGVVAS